MYVNQNQTRQSDAKPVISERRHVIIPSVILAVQFLLTLFVASVTSLMEAAGGGLMLIYIDLFAFFSYPVAGILGLIYVVVSIIRKRVLLPLAYVLFFTSIAMTSISPAIIWTRWLADLLAPAASSQNQRFIEKGRVQHANRVQEDYAALTMEFKTPQTVKNSKSMYLLLQSGHVVTLYGTYMSKDLANQFASFAREHIVGKSVTITLPEFDTFSQNYGPGTHSGVFFDVKSKTYGDVPGFVFFEGELLNKRFARNPGLFERLKILPTTSETDKGQVNQTQ